MEEVGIQTRNRTLKKIVVIGPESTGKSTICEQLSVSHNVTYLPEFARQYLEQHGAEYSFEDVLKMAKGQLDSEINFKPNGDYQFIDTNLIVYKIWIKEKYNLVIDWIEENIENSKVDLYFLCDIDIAWEEDPLREHPAEADRVRLFENYKIALENLSVPFVILSGSQLERLETAKAALKKIQ